MPNHYSKSGAEVADEKPAQIALSPSQKAQVLLRVLGLVFPTSRWGKRIVIGLLILFIIAITAMFVVAKWYAQSQSDKPTSIGVSFIPAYARFLGVDPQETMDALLDINVKQFRLVSYWNEMEPKPGEYNFQELDWQFRKAEAADAKISLAIGLRQPRWPECHTPDWARQQPPSVWQPKLNRYITTVVNRYKTSPALESYQLENEFFNSFGLCDNFDRQRLVAEYNLVKKLDPVHPVIVSKSSNTPVPGTGQPRPDITGISIYRRVWDGNVTGRYFTYPFPSWYYGFIAGVQKISTGRDSVIHELQMESWPPDNKSITEISLAEQGESMNAAMFEDRVTFAKQTGMRSIDLWGAEWWYWQMKVKNEPGLWNEAREIFRNN